MNHNLLLYYLSEICAGKWQKFQSAFSELNKISEEELFPSVVARHLSSLGHIEFDFDGDLSWAVAPATLACLPPNYDQGKLQAVLCGKRSGSLLRQLDNSAEKHLCEMTTTSQKEGPDRIVITAPTFDVIEQIARAVNIAFQPLAAQHLANILPPLSTLLPLYEDAPEPQGYRIEQFNADKCCWEEVAKSAELGLYRYHVYPYLRPHRLKLPDRLVKISPQLGIYLWLEYQKKVVWQYLPQQQRLIAPASAVLPPLYGRVLVLCSGLLPTFERGKHLYENIPNDIVRPFLRKIAQEEKVTSP